MFWVVSITDEYLEANYLRILPMLLGDEKVAVISNGMAFDAKQFNGPSALTALRDMAKLKGLQKQEDVTKGGINVTVNVANMV